MASVTKKANREIAKKGAGKIIRRKTYNKGELFEETVENAMLMVKRGTGIRTAAKMFGISHTTLKYRITQKNLNRVPNNIYKNTLFTKREEEMLVAHALQQDCLTPQKENQNNLQSTCTLFSLWFSIHFVVTLWIFY